uniref:Reverse transcriptase domain-containing protein n=1 Tax=Photinus pyralis TaxID=7054 RepID=A0A1Y1LAD0_PHOPY
MDKSGHHLTNNIIIPRKENYLRWNDNKRNAYVNISSMSYRISSLQDSQDVNELSQNLNLAINEVGKLLGLQHCSQTYRTIRGSNKPWFDTVCKNQKNEVRISYKLAKSHNFGQVYLQNFIKAKKQFKAICRKKKHDFNLLYRSRITNIMDSNTFWQTFKREKNRTRITSAPVIEIQRWVNFYKHFYSHIHSDLNFNMHDVLHPFLDRPITSWELNKALQHAPTGKAMGLDGISNEFLKNLSMNWHTYILRLFNRILDSEQIPYQWSKIKMIHLHKKGDISVTDNYRGIAIMNHIAKIFNYIIYNRISNFVEESQILPESQCGFRRGRDCQDNIFVLNAIIFNNIRLKKQRMYALFVDFKKAFDSIQHDLLWQKLSQTGISAKLIRLIKGFYSKATLQIEQEGRLSEVINITKGVLQGDVLSPLLFSLFTADMEAFLKN